MLAVQSMLYYRKIIDILNILNDEIKFLENYTPIEEKNYILKKFLNSRGGANTNDYVYCIYKSECENGDLLKYYNDKFVNFNKEFKFHDFSSKVVAVEYQFNTLCDENNYEDDAVKLYIDKLKKLSKLHEELVMNSYGNEYKINFFEEVEKIIREYNFLKHMINQFINSLKDDKESKFKKEEDNLSIQLLDVKYDVKEFSEILGNIANTYSTLSTLVKNDNGSLKINKIESGSLFMETYGNGIIIGVISELLVKIIEIIYNKYKNRTKIDSLGKEINMIASSAETIKKLEEIGIEINDENKKNVGECLSYAINELKKIVVKTPKIKINGKTYSVNDAKEYLEYSKKLIDVNIKK